MNISDNNKFYKIKVDGTQKTRVPDEIVFTEDSVSIFIIEKDWLYYRQPNDYEKLYRMQKPDKNKNDWKFIYCRDYDWDSKHYMIDTEGKGTVIEMD